MNKFNTKKARSLLPYFVFAVAIIVVVRIVIDFSFFTNFVVQLWGIITPFFYGFLLAYIVNIPRGAIERSLSKSQVKFIAKRTRGFSIILAFLIFALVIALMLVLIIPPISRSITFFIANIPYYQEGIMQGVMQAVDFVNDLNIPGVVMHSEDIIGLIDEVFSFEHLVHGVGAGTITAFVGLSSVVFRAFLAFISSIYILLDKDKFKAFLRRMLKVYASPKVHDAVTMYSARLNKNFKQYIYTQTIDGCILGTIVTVQLYLMGSPYFLVLGIMLGIINYVPYFGSIFGSLIAIIVVTFTQGLRMGAIASVVLLITQQIDGNVIQPKLMGKDFLLSPLLVIISIVIGGAFAGVLGMIAAIPIVAILKDMLDNVTQYYERQKLEKPSTDDEDEDDESDDSPLEL